MEPIIATWQRNAVQGGSRAMAERFTRAEERRVREAAVADGVELERDRTHARERPLQIAPAQAFGRRAVQVHVPHVESRAGQMRRQGDTRFHAASFAVEGILNAGTERIVDDSPDPNPVKVAWPMTTRAREPSRVALREPQQGPSATDHVGLQTTCRGSAHEPSQIAPRELRQGPSATDR
ncbi:hypothetical protein ET445_09065 [Agromyces protaetiae]|uniref:Uncharacterized protein n=1 Tax=Agromyces protaetiae TaxID=2509455 RepID=A0A4P6FCE4_9MICO|nr:hypothetical protein [Agromyces protaetiae]QAY73465.1 hypothetical protein ET445_09065 [Agromyces protaetiae]